MSPDSTTYGTVNNRHMSSCNIFKFFIYKDHVCFKMGLGGAEVPNKNSALHLENTSVLTKTFL